MAGCTQHQPPQRIDDQRNNPQAAAASAHPLPLGVPAPVAVSHVGIHPNRQAHRVGGLPNQTLTGITGITPSSCATATYYE